MRNAIVLLLSALAGLNLPLTGEAAWEHALYDSVSLDGEWEMAYQPYAWETVDYPTFAGVKVANAVPGYWEDMEPAFRAAGMTDRFRVNPWFLR